MPSKKRVLLVENDVEHAELIRSEFERFPEFCTFSWLQTPEDVLCRLHNPAASWPHLLLIDATLQQPGDGITLLRSIKRDARRHTIPIVMLSDSTHPEEVTSAYRSGANAYLVKPVNAAETRRLVQETLHFWCQWNHMPIAEAHEGVPTPPA